MVFSCSTVQTDLLDLKVDTPLGSGDETESCIDQATVNRLAQVGMGIVAG